MWKFALLLVSLIPTVATSLPCFDTDKWIQQLNVQKCAIVQIANGLCSLFLEHDTSNKTTDKYYLGTCDCKTMANWQWCGVHLKKARPRECTFDFSRINSNTESSRVHRRFCDLTGIAEWAAACNCSNRQMVSFLGLPTCVAPARSICKSNVCGTAKCASELVAGQVSKVKCSEKCPQKQPFCEKLGPQSSQHISVCGKWTNFPPPICQSGTMIAVSRCIDQSGRPAFDCLGPGTKCCSSANDGECICSVSHQDGYLVVTRTTSICVT